jgi:muramidase (phage lysozyme)
LNLFSARSVLSIFQLSRRALAASGLGIAFGIGLAGPAFAADQPSSWTLKVAPAPAPRLAFLPPLPAAPRVFALTLERRAMLNTIRYAEGTWANGHEIGYRIMFGGGVFDSLERHPDRVNYSSRYASAAAGAYQFMPPTWNMVSRAMGLTGFHPEAQDQAALFLVQRRGALALVDRGEMTPELAARLAPEWASFPTLAGNSFYGQPVKRFDDLKRFYEDNLSQLRNDDQTRWERVAIRQLPPPRPCDDRSLSCRLESVAPVSTIEAN